MKATGYTFQTKEKVCQNRITGSEVRVLVVIGKRLLGVVHYNEVSFWHYFNSIFVLFYEKYGSVVGSVLTK